MTMTERERRELHLDMLPEIARSVPVPWLWPARMRELSGELVAAGWRIGLSQGEDSGSHRFLTFEALSPDRERKARVCWHSRATGGRTLRLFSCMLFEPYRGWHDLTVKGLIVAVRQ